jgi:cytochrome c biogenesis protein CcdA
VPDAAYGWALSAGLVAALNPCGFALLPAYLSVLVMGDGDGPRAVWRALALTGSMTVGFVAVFGGFGLLAAPLADTVARHLPWLTVVIGVALVGLGGWVLAGRGLPWFAPRAGGGRPVTRQAASMIVFGASYAIASLGCTVGPFLAVVVAGFRAGSATAGVGLFLAYAAGMALVVGATSVAVALARDSWVRRLRRAAPLVARIGGALMILAGTYVAWYGAYELRVFAGADGADPIVDGAGRLQRALASAAGAVGPAGLLAILVLLVTVGAVVPALRRRRAGRSRSSADRPH